MSFDAFYQAMADGAETRTSQVNVDEYVAYFTPFLEGGQDILHVTLSSGISGTYNSACLARDELSAKYPERKIYVVDSLGASSGYGLLMVIFTTIAKKKFKLSDKMRKTMDLYFTAASRPYFGAQCSAAGSAWNGSLCCSSP